MLMFEFESTSGGFETSTRKTPPFAQSARTISCHIAMLGKAGDGMVDCRGMGFSRAEPTPPAFEAAGRDIMEQIR